MKNEKVSVLIIDDEPLLSKSLVGILQENNYDVRTTSFGRQAIDWLKEGFDVVLLDVKLPDMDGIDVLKTINRRYPHIVTIIISGFSTVDTAVSYMNEGAYSYISKPFEVDDLIGLINRGLKQKQEVNYKERLLNNLSLLHQVNTEMEGLIESQGIANLASQYLVEITKIDVCVVLLFDSKQREFVFGAISGASEGLDQIRQKRFKLDQKIYEKLIFEKSAVLIPELKSTPDILKYIPIKNPKSMFIFPLVTKDKVMGLALFVGSQAMQLSDETLETVKTITDRAAVCIENANRYLKLKSDYVQAITLLASAVEDKFEHQKGHSEAVSELAVMIARKINLKNQEIELIRIAGLLHDIGKISVSDNILMKKSQLTVEEFMKLKAHSIASADILSKMELHKEILPMVLYHHERFDGTGYPEGLIGESIPIGARILAVCDAYKAMTTARPYRKNLKHHEAITELKRCAGKQFDPDIVNAFVKIVEKKII